MTVSKWIESGPRYTVADLPIFPLLVVINKIGFWYKENSFVGEVFSECCLIKAMCEQLLLWTPVDN